MTIRFFERRNINSRLMSMGSTMTVQGVSAGKNIKKKRTNFCNILQQLSCALMLFDAGSGETRNLQSVIIK